MFVERINSHNVDDLCEIMAEDHVFIDSLGNRLEGREMMRGAWAMYFNMFPDYNVSATEVIRRGDVVALFGSACGTYSVNEELSEENRWEIPVALKAVIRDNLIAEWRVYADNDPVRQIMSRAMGIKS